MTELTIEVAKREALGKNANRRLRASGGIPAVVYGGGREPVAIQLNRKGFLDLMRQGSGENTVFLLRLAGTDSSRHTMIRDMQVNRLTNEVQHVDFLRVEMNQRIRVEVHIELTGTAIGVKNEDGLLDFVTRAIEVECLPADIPEHLSLDVSSLHVGQHLEAKDIALPKGITLMTEPERVIASVGHGRLEHHGAGGEGLLEAGAVEPEVMARGKEKA